MAAWQAWIVAGTAFTRHFDAAARADRGMAVRPPITTIATTTTQAGIAIHPIDFRVIVYPRLEQKWPRNLAYET